MLANFVRSFALLAVLLVVRPSLAQQNDSATQRKPAKPAAHEGHEEKMADRAIAVLIPIGESGVSGYVAFTREGEKVHVSGRVKGLKPGKHGFHVHQYGDLSDLKTGKSAGDHFNPDETPHGRPEDAERHVGDLGNIEANEDGVAEIDITDTHLQLGGPHSILGRAIVIHAGEDKFTQPAGDAGDRVAVGVIGVAGPRQ